MYIGNNSCTPWSGTGLALGFHPVTRHLTGKEGTNGGSGFSSPALLPVVEAHKGK